MLAQIIPFNIAKKITNCNLIIFYYHVINNDQLNHIYNLYKYKNINQFRQDLDFLLKHYSPIALSDAIMWVRENIDLPRNAFLLTFDDGFSEIYDLIAPILLEKGITSTFFISTAFLDNQELCYQQKASLLLEKISKGISPCTKKEVQGILLNLNNTFSSLHHGISQIDYKHRCTLDEIAVVLGVDFQEYLKIKKPYLTTEQVRYLIKHGFTIGSHSIDHPHYSTLTLEEQLRQTRVSVRQIKELFGLNYGAFAFPHNDDGVSDEFFREICNENLLDISFGTGGIVNGKLRRHKQRVSLEKPLLPAKDIILWQYMRKIYRSMKSDKLY